MGDTIHHRTTKVATEAIALALNGHTLSAGRLQEHLEDEMENAPHKNTVNSVLRQLREDGFLRFTAENASTLSRDMQEWREGSFIGVDEIDAENIAKGAAKAVSTDIETAVMEELTGDSYYRNSRTGKLKRKSINTSKGED